MSKTIDTEASISISGPTILGKDERIAAWAQ
jgi:hypothetical protein